jgi:hypothetical protein
VSIRFVRRWYADESREARWMPNASGNRYQPDNGRSCVSRCAHDGSAIDSRWTFESWRRSDVDHCYPFLILDSATSDAVGFGQWNAAPDPLDAARRSGAEELASGLVTRGAQRAEPERCG